jgi:excisionase family DNA binding protein
MLVPKVKTGIPNSKPDRPEDRYNAILPYHAKLLDVGLAGRTQLLPTDLDAFLKYVQEELEADRPVVILKDDAEFTTMKAARILNVSRQFMVKLLEQWQIPFHKVGTHRRVYARDLLAYKIRRDARRKVLDDLARAEMADGTYDAIPVNGPKSESR